MLKRNRVGQQASHLDADPASIITTSGIGVRPELTTQFSLDFDGRQNVFGLFNNQFSVLA